MKRIIKLTERDLTRIVKRVIMEQGDASKPIAAGGGGEATKTVKINGVDISTYDETTKKNKTYPKMLSQAYRDFKLGNETIRQISIDDATNDSEFIVYVSDAKLNDYEKSVKDPKGWAYYVRCEDLDKTTELPGGSPGRGFGNLKSMSGLKTMNHNFKLDEASKLMLKRRCIAYFPKYELPYKNTTPLYDN